MSSDGATDKADDAVILWNGGIMEVSEPCVLRVWSVTDRRGRQKIKVEGFRPKLLKVQKPVVETEPAKVE